MFISVGRKWISVGGRLSERTRCGWKERWGKEEQKEGVKRKEQKYEVKISSIPYAIHRWKVENNGHEIFL